ncbi:MAG: metal-dependent hydrolase [bacterium]
MPDLLTHALFSYPAKKIFPKKLVFILIGSILPDLLGRSLGIFILNPSIVGWYQTVVHTPFSLVLIIYCLSFFFPQGERKTIFTFLLIGIVSHLFLDLFQKSIGLDYLWLFPFSFSSFQIPLIWPDESILFIPILIFINFVIFFSLNFKKYAKK